MSEVAAEVLTQFVAKQAQVWQGVALHLSEQSNTLVEIPTPTTTAVPIAELTGLTVDTVLHIQAHFGEHPESPCIFVVGEQPGERAAAQKALLEATLGSAPETIDESALQKAQEFGTHLLQGLALAFGNLSGKTFTPGQVVARYEPIVFPPNFLTVDEVIVTRFVVRVPDREPIALSWMLTEDLARALLGMPAAASDPFASLSAEPSSAQAPTPTPTAPAFNPFAETEESSERNLELLLDIPLEVSVELGRVTMLVRDLLEIGTGSIVELQKAAGEPVEVLVNGRLIARGEVVVVEDNFAVRITEIIPPTERVQRLGA
ncbi:MAG: flagellar motor switch protein FliN [Fimbriimonadales bacterium]|nr:flagellar motor switch protein FliN [Fimbriimonadales bacterium]MDW8052160.1 flagellar motor switch protein FliN [Armatimonadota bacterium]